MNTSEPARLSKSASDALQAVPAIPRDDEGPVFAEPWQAQVFAITLVLYERGVFSWAEWAQQLSAAIDSAQVAGMADDGRDYYRHWLAALEAMLLCKGLAVGDQLSNLKLAWADAAKSTPHGQAIELSAKQRAELTSDR